MKIAAPSTVVLGVLLAALLTACGAGDRRDDPSPNGREARGWTRHDLRKHRPREPQGAARVETRWYNLGQGITRRPRAGPVAGRVLALTAPAGHELRWTVDLGDEPFLSYVPLSHGAAPCALTYRARVVDADGAAHDVHRHPAEPRALFAPATVEIRLEAFARQRIELALALEAEGEGCAAARAVWGSPAVYSRRETGVGPGSAEWPNVILLGLDTLRADALGAYGRQPSVTPAIDRFAAAADVWLEAFSCFNVTNPGFASILTGLYGKNHGVYDLRTPLGEEHATLAELFAEAGYETAAVVSARHLDHRLSGLGQGFGTYRPARGQYAAAFAVDEAIDWISRRRRPFFLWLHLFDPHTPHTPPQPYASGYRPAAAGLAPIAEWVPFRQPGQVGYDSALGGHRELYAAEVAYLDRQLGRLLDFLASRRLLARSVVALVADHGENLGEHGLRYRHAGLWDTTTRVPLMIRWPGQRRGRRIPGLVQTVDLFPTLLGAAELETPPQDGLDLRSARGRRAVFAEASGRQGAMVRTPQHLLFQAFRDHASITAGPYLYDLGADPLQRRNLAGTGREAEDRLAGALRDWLADRRPGEAPAPAPLSEEQLEQLRSLGYVDAH